MRAPEVASRYLRVTRNLNKFFVLGCIELILEIGVQRGIRDELHTLLL